MGTTSFALITGLSLVLAYVNGFHDASNAVSTAIATRVMKERHALAFAAVLNLLGALLGVGLAALTGSWALSALSLDRVAAGDTAGTSTSAGSILMGSDALVPVLIGTLLAVIVWSLLTWWLGAPSSTWQTILGAVAGSCLVLGLTVPSAGLVGGILVPLLLAPLLGAAAAYGLARVVTALGDHERIGTDALNVLQTISAGAVAVGHGLNDARIPMAFVVLAAVGSSPGAGTRPGSVIAVGGASAVAVAVASGTFVGGRRIIRTLSRRLTNLVGTQGFAAETATAVVMGVVAGGLGVPVSTSQTLTSSIVGAGLAAGPRQIRWKVFGQIVLTWVATPLVAAALGAVLTLLVQRLI
jgi:PiT family inorganic phosphate transporter